MNNFIETWVKYLTIPPQPLMLVLDAAMWVSSSALTCLLARLVLPHLALPLFVLIVGLIVASFYSPRLRVLAIIRVILLIFGLVIVL